jgi:hypothetical protein
MSVLVFYTDETIDKHCVLGNSQNLLTFWILIFKIICFYYDYSDIC